MAPRRRSFTDFCFFLSPSTPRNAPSPASEGYPGTTAGIPGPFQRYRSLPRCLEPVDVIGDDVADSFLRHSFILFTIDDEKKGIYPFIYNCCASFLTMSIALSSGAPLRLGPWPSLLDRPRNFRLGLQNRRIKRPRPCFDMFLAFAAFGLAWRGLSASYK